jgi:ankyrin repeat protein
MRTVIQAGTPPGITLARNDRAELVIIHRTHGMRGLKIFAWVWCTFWLGMSGFALLGMWRESASFASFIAKIGSHPGLWMPPLFFGICLVVAAFFIWLLYKQTILTLRAGEIEIERRLGLISWRKILPKSTFTAFQVKKDGGEGDDSFPSWAVQAEFSGNTTLIVARQEREVADWLCLQLSQWLGKAPSPYALSAPPPMCPAPTREQLENAARTRKWLFPSMALVMLIPTVFMFREPLTDLVSSIANAQRSYQALADSEKSASKILHALSPTPLVIDTRDDVSWRLTTFARGNVSIVDGNLVYELDEFALYDRFDCRMGCEHIVSIRFQLATESERAFHSIAASKPLMLNAPLRASGYKRGKSTVVLIPDGNISAAELARAWPQIAVEVKRGDSSGHTYHEPKRGVWRDALIAGTADGNAYWNKACDETRSMWAIINMRCDETLAARITSPDDANKPIERGLGRDQAPLRLASDVNNETAVALLIKAGADPNAKSSGGTTALFAAAESGYTGVVRQLLKAGADFHAAQGSDGEPETPLASAASFKRWDIVELLVNSGANPNVRDRNGWAPIDFAAMHACGAGREDILKLLIDKGSKVDETIPDLKRGAEYQNLRPLIYAAAYSKAAAINLLLAHGADINKPDHAGMTPLMLAVRNRREDIVEALLAKGADLKATDQFGRAALNYATFNATPSIVKRIAAAGSNLNFTAPPGMHHGETALMHAVQGGNLNNVEAMLALGARTHVTDAKGMTALDHARQVNRKDMLALLTR